MDFKASCEELSNISIQLKSENENITSNLSKIEKAVDTLKLAWKDGSSETYCSSLLEYVKSVSKLIAYYKTIGTYVGTIVDKYNDADTNSFQKTLINELEDYIQPVYDTYDGGDGK